MWIKKAFRDGKDASWTQGLEDFGERCFTIGHFTKNSKEDDAGLRLSPRAMSKDRPSQWYNRMGDVGTCVSEPFETLAEAECNPA